MNGVLSLCLTITTLASADAAPHVEQNPVLRNLLESGVSVGDQSQELPQPTLPDGLTPEQQHAVIEKLGGARYSFDRLARKSVVAPQIVRVSDLPESDVATAVRTVDFWFIVHADLDAVSDQQFLRMLLGVERPEGEATALTREELAERDIEVPAERVERESFGHLSHALLDKVLIEATGRSCWSSTDESVVAAVNVDRRFVGDEQFPNQWQLIGDDDTVVADSHPYEGLGFYIKITRLHEPAGAMFVEFHMAFAEPLAWFRGTNQLGAKLPAVVQNQVREARRLMMTASRDRGE